MPEASPSRNHGAGAPLAVNFDRKHLERAKLMIRNRQWLMERVNSTDCGLRQQSGIAHAYKTLDDAELIAGFRAAAAKAGLTPDDLIAWMEEAVH